MAVAWNLPEWCGHPAPPGSVGPPRPTGSELVKTRMGETDPSAASTRTSAELSGRQAAHRAVLGALRGESYVSESLRALRTAQRLPPRDAGLAMEIAQTAVRRRITIDRVLAAVARYNPRRVRDELRAVLYCAAAQILWMDRVPEYAAVDEAVRMARARSGRRAAGMVNAVLRSVVRAIDVRRVAWRRLSPRLLRAGWDEACAMKLDVLSAPERDGMEAHLADATGERLERYRLLVRRFGAETAEQAAWASQAAPATVLHPNRLRIGDEAFAAGLREAFGEAVELAAGAAFLPPSAHLFDAAPMRDGCAYVQDATQHAAARLLAARPGERLLDLCAAPGGKSLTLALDMRDTGELLACDVAAERISQVEENIRRLGLGCVRTQLLHVDDACSALSGAAFDGAIVDVPCSNTGTIARRPEARLGLTGRKLDSLLRVQARLLRQAAAAVRAGGRLVYSTCSIEPEENEQIVQRFLRERSEWTIAEQRLTLPQWGPRWSDWRDGGYAARLEYRK